MRASSREKNKRRKPPYRTFALILPFATAGIPYLRTLIFSVGVLAEFMILLQILG